MKALTDTIQTAVKDTGLVAQTHYHCTNPGHCKNHPLKNPDAKVDFISPLTINFHDAIEQGEITFPVINDSDFQKPKELVTFAIKDTQEHNNAPAVLKTNKQMHPLTLQPCDSSILEKGDTRTSQEIIGVIPQPKTLDDFGDYMKYEPMAQGMLITFMGCITALYIIRSASHWSAMAYDMRKVFSKTA